jgi:hypothetical protein
VTDLTKSQWHDVVKAAIYLPQDAHKRAGRFIALDTLAMILRKSRRTTDQNALLWALYEDILEQGGEILGGWTKDDLHEYCLGEHFGWERREAFGAVRQVPRRRSSRLSKTDFSNFVEFIVRRMTEHGIVLELPGEIAA